MQIYKNLFHFHPNESRISVHQRLHLTVCRHLRTRTFSISTKIRNQLLQLTMWLTFLIAKIGQRTSYGLTQLPVEKFFPLELSQHRINHDVDVDRKPPCNKIQSDFH